MTAWRALREGFDAFVRRLPLLFGAWLVILAVQQALDLLIPESMILLSLAAPFVVLPPLYAGQHRLALAAVRDEPVAFRDLFVGFPRFGVIVVAYLVVQLLTAVATMVFIIPGIIVFLTYAFVLIQFVDPERGDPRPSIRSAMRRSAEITDGHRGSLFLVYLLLGVPILVWSLVTYFSIVAGVRPWIAELIAIFGGFLFIGPVSATSSMVIYDHALKRLQEIENPDLSLPEVDVSDDMTRQQTLNAHPPTGGPF